RSRETDGDSELSRGASRFRTLARMLSTPRLALVLAAVSLGCSPTTSSSGTTPPADNNAAAGGGATIGGAPADPAEHGAEGTGPAGQEGAATGVVAGSPNDTRFISAEISH